VREVYVREVYTYLTMVAESFLRILYQAC
jgi:hypothetical protein